MGTTIERSEASHLPAMKPCNRPSGLSRCRGVTLIELSFVIGLIAIIVVAALAVYNAARSSQDLTTAVSDVSAIRTAVSNWASNEPIFRDANQTVVPSTKLENLAQIGRLLPGKLRERATSGLTLPGVNPWQGDYRLLEATEAVGVRDQTGESPSYAENLFVFAIEITQIPSTQHEPLRRRLLEGAEAISATEGTGVTEEGEKTNLFVVYRI